MATEGDAFPRSRCGTCACEWLNPPPSGARLSAAYSSDYYGEGDTKFQGPVERVIQWFRGGRARAAARLTGGKGRVLDIGCGNGGFLRELSALGPFEIHGIELPGGSADRAAKVPGLKLQQKPLEDGDYPVASFDLITLFHVIEHLPEPGKLFPQAARLLKPGGHLVISLPNCASWQAALCGQHWLHWDPPRHLWLSPPSALETRATAAGLRLVASHHLSLEQNPFGVLQGVLNKFFPRDRLYNWLKRKGSAARAAGLPWPDLIVTLFIGFPCVLFSLLEALFRRGGTMELRFQRPS